MGDPINPKFQLNQRWRTVNGAIVEIVEFKKHHKTQPIKVRFILGSDGVAPTVPKFMQLSGEGTHPRQLGLNLLVLTHDTETKPQVGETWKSRNGNIVTVVANGHNVEYPMAIQRADDSERITTITKDGRVYSWDEESPWDLVERVETAVPELAVGQKWRTRGGRTVTIKQGVDGYDFFQVEGDEPCWWYRNHQKSKHEHAPGVFVTGHEDALVELIADTGTKEKPKFAVGQRWKSRNGRTATIIEIRTGGPKGLTVEFEPAKDGEEYHPSQGDNNRRELIWPLNLNGKWGHHEDPLDLVELIADEAKAETNETPFVVIGLTETEARVLAHALDNIGGPSGPNTPRGALAGIRALLPFKIMEPRDSARLTVLSENGTYYKNDVTLDNFPRADTRHEGV